MIRVVCPGCQRSLRGADSQRGKIVSCPNCEQSILLEAPEDEVPYRLEGMEQENEGIQDSLTDPPEGQQGIRIGVDPEKLTAKRFRKKRKRRRPATSSLGEYWHYYTAAFGPFGFVLVGLFVLWLGLVALTPLVPPIARGLIYGGWMFYLVGSWWITFIAYREDGWAGTLCFFTNFYVYVYSYTNMDLTWKPAGLMLLGLLMFISGYATGFYFGGL